MGPCFRRDDSEIADSDLIVPRHALLQAGGGTVSLTDGRFIMVS